MIYFDTEHEAYQQRETIDQWGKTYLCEYSEEVYQDYVDGKLIWQNDELVVNPEYEAQQAAKEAERIGNLKVTKRVFALALQELGITYSQLKALIATSEQAQLEWDLCVELERKNPLLDTMAAQLNITPTQLDYIFRKANGEEINED